MSKLIRLIILVSVISMCLGAPPRVSADSPWPPFCQEGSLPSHDPQYPADQKIITCIPQKNWNGMLVIFAHGYVAAQFPLDLPTDQLTIDGFFMPTVLLSQGFAFATTSYHKNGYAVEQARKDLNDLLNYFKKQVQPGSLQKVFLVGASEGGEVVTMMIENYPDKYAGALALCGPIGGAAYEVGYLSDFRVVFDYFFPGVLPGSAANVPTDAWTGWNGDMQAIFFAMSANPGATAQLFSVVPAGDTANPATYVATAVSILWYSIFGTNDLLATAGGMPYGNRTTVYSGSLDDAALNAGVERVKADPRAQAYMKRFYQPTGELMRPFVTLHNTLDPVVPFQHELIYQGLAAGTGHGSLFTPIPVPTYGHCNFTFQQINAAFGLLVQKALNP